MILEKKKKGCDSSCKRTILSAILGTGVAVTILAAVVIAASIVDNRSFAAF